jgi:hypothetical protein
MLRKVQNKQCTLNQVESESNDRITILVNLLVQIKFQIAEWVLYFEKKLVFFEKPFKLTQDL